jgi:hypothetical protein
MVETPITKVTTGGIGPRRHTLEALQGAKGLLRTKGSRASIIKWYALQ